MELLCSISTGMVHVFALAQTMDEKKLHHPERNFLRHDVQSVFHERPHHPNALLKLLKNLLMNHNQ
ncbi:MAG: hypothetical protein WA151_15940 [Desulfatirhabdiaceae bacterium]